MMTHHLEREMSIPLDLREVFDFFSNASNLEVITPPEMRLEILTEMPLVMAPGVLIDYRVRIGGIPVKWRSRITSWNPPHEFVDELFRITERPKAFTVMTLFRSGINIGLKLTLIVSGWGVSGVLWADLIASLLFVAALAPTLVRNLTVGFSLPLLKEAAAFGLPKVPHGIAHQVLNLSDRKLIEIFAALSASGLYHIGYMMGTGAISSR